LQIIRIEFRAVAVWDDYGTFSQEDISTMISAYEVNRKSGYNSVEKIKKFASLET